MEYNSVFIVNNIEDFKNIRKQYGNFQGSLVVTTHSKLHLYLTTISEQLDFVSIFNYISEKEINESQNANIRLLQNDMRYIDAVLSKKVMSSWFDCDLALFSSFLYRAILALTSLRSLETCIYNLTQKIIFQKLIICDKTLNDLLPLDIMLSTVVRSSLKLKHLDIQYFYYPEDKEVVSKIALIKSVLTSKHLFKKAFNVLFSKIYRKRKARREFTGDSLSVYDFLINDKNQLFSQFDWRFISKEAISYNNLQTMPAFVLTAEECMNALPSNSTSDSIYRLYVGSYTRLICQNFASLIGPVWNLSQYLKKEKINFGIWDSAPIDFNSTPIIFQYLLGLGIPVYGIQHGAAYVDQYYPLHVYSDFVNCSNYFSYGFEQKDIDNAYAGRNENLPKVHPLGQIYKTRSEIGDSLTECDLVFPITNSAGLFDGGDARLLPDVLLQRQLDLLKILNNLKNRKIIVKPFFLNRMGFNYLLHLRKQFPNLEFIDNITYTHFLQHYKPKGVLIEFPSTPLYETLAIDTEIFLMGDSMLPFSPDALGRLDKRVHYSDDIAGLEVILKRWDAGNLMRKRDTQFYEYYVDKLNARDNLLNVFPKNSQAC
jgi:hypothetical protein